MLIGPPIPEIEFDLKNSRSKVPQSAQRPIVRDASLALVVFEMASRSQCHAAIYVYIIVKHPIHPEFPPRVTATSYVYDVPIATSKHHVYIIQQA